MIALSSVVRIGAFVSMSKSKPARRNWRSFKISHMKIDCIESREKEKRNKRGRLRQRLKLRRNRRGYNRLKSSRRMRKRRGGRQRSRRGWLSSRLRLKKQEGEMKRPERRHWLIRKELRSIGSEEDTKVACRVISGILLYCNNIWKKVMKNL